MEAKLLFEMIYETDIETDTCNGGFYFSYVSSTYSQFHVEWDCHIFPHPRPVGIDFDISGHK